MFTTQQGAQDEAPAAPPALLSERYALGERIGAGGFGEVWAATDRLQGEAVAIKLLPAFGGQAVFRARQELCALRRARLPGVVSLKNDGIDGGYYYIVMERVEGLPFPGLPVPCAWEALAPRAIRLLRTLAAVHFAGLVHLDLKPSNVLVRSDGAPVLLDFGLASGAALATTWGQNSGFTRHFAPPEQITGHPRGVASDLYALGAMLAYALTGELPPRGCAALPGPAGPLIAAMLAEDPDDRPKDATVVLAALGEDAAPAVALPEGPGPHGEAALRPLFAGPDAFLHLPEDAAAELWRRTGGWPEHLRHELSGWVSAGLAAVEGGRLVLARTELDRLRAGLVVAPDPPRPVPPGAAALLQVFGALQGRATPALLSAATGLSAAEVQAALAELEAARLAWPIPGWPIPGWPIPGWPTPGWPTSGWPTPGWPTSGWPMPGGEFGARPVRGDPAPALRLVGLLPPEHPARLHLMVRAGVEPAEILRQVLDRLDACVGAGSAGEAFALTDFGLGLARAGAGEVLPILERMCAIVLSEESGAFLDHARYELERTEPSFALEQLEALLRAALAIRSGEPRRARVEIGSVNPFAYEPLEIRRVAFRVRAAWAERVDETALDYPARWATTDERRGWLLTWRGNLRYAQRDYAQAAALHDEAAALRRGYGRAASLLNAALARLEVHELDRCAALAEEVAAWARANRWPATEAQAHWLLRHVAYREDRAGEPREDLAEAAVFTGPLVEGLFALNEAAVAWRAGETALAAGLASRAGLAARVAGSRGTELLADALSLHLRGEEATEALLNRVRACAYPGLALQALALTAGPGAALPPELDRFIRETPAAQRHARRELLSVAECAARLGGV